MPNPVAPSKLMPYLTCAILLLAGCGHFRKQKAEVFVPDLPTVGEQYVFATRAAHLRALSLASDEKRGNRKEIDEIRAAYAKVIDRFPDDMQYTPLAKLKLIELSLMSKDFDNALSRSDSLILEMGALLEADVKKLAYVDLMARFDRAQALEGMNRMPEAQAGYKDCVDRYKDSTEARMKDVARTAQSRYQRVFTIGESKDKDKSKKEKK